LRGGGDVCSDLLGATRRWVLVTERLRMKLDVGRDDKLEPLGSRSASAAACLTTADVVRPLVGFSWFARNIDDDFVLGLVVY
jgi:hypothetical protein